MMKSPRICYSLSSSSSFYLFGNSLISYSHITRSISDFMSTNHEQQTEVTNVDKTKLTYPNNTQLADNNSTEIDYTIRLVLANTDDSEKENDRTNIR